MTTSGYIRVSVKRPCLICGKPDWCSRTDDETISFCARVTTGADRISLRQGWGVFYHDRDLAHKPSQQKHEPRNLCKIQTEEISLAPLEIRDFIYASLLRLSPAGNYPCLTVGKKGLLERGLANFADYGGLPGSVSERKDLAAQLSILLNQTFTSFVRQNPLGLRHVPGFWIDDYGEANLWQPQDFPQPFLLIPYRNPTGQIQGCQIRFPGHLSANKKRYLWLSLPARNSASSGTPLHFASWKNFGQKDNFGLPVLVTEGALKADTVASLTSEFLVIAGGGVSCSQDLIVKLTQGVPLALAFDNDYRENPAVARQLAKLLKLRFGDNRKNNVKAATEILVWSHAYKGVDDALLNKEKVQTVNILDWFSSLDKNCRIEVRQVWEETA